MISHPHQCIFLHITKCAGTSVEGAFGAKFDEESLDRDTLYGWSEEQKIHLQHATPDELIDGGWIDRAVWDRYYKFVVVRNSWDRAMSDYFWVMNDQAVIGSFKDFLKGEGVFKRTFSVKSRDSRIAHFGDQSRYFTLGGELIRYDRVLRFESLNEGLAEVSKDLNLPSGFFAQRLNILRNGRGHYSLFYSPEEVELVREKYREDIERFGCEYEERKRGLDWLRPRLRLVLHPLRWRFLRYRFPRTYLNYWHIISAPRRLKLALMRR